MKIKVKIKKQYSEEYLKGYNKGMFVSNYEIEQIITECKNHIDYLNEIKTISNVLNPKDDFQKRLFKRN